MAFSDLSKAVLKTVNNVFGVSISYTHISGSPPAVIKGVFDNAFVEIQGVTTLKPVLKIQLSDLIEEPIELDRVVIDSITYTVLDSQPDIYGATLLILEKI
jgi:hypothetical protein